MAAIALPLGPLTCSNSRIRPQAFQLRCGSAPLKSVSEHWSLKENASRGLRMVPVEKPKKTNGWTLLVVPQRRTLHVTKAAGQGFGVSPKVVPASKAKSSEGRKGGAREGSALKGRRGTLSLKQAPAEGSDVAEEVCPCGGGEEKRAYKDCCSRFHGGVKEPDAPTLLRARYAAFARGVVPYIVRTTHGENPDFLRGGTEQLTADCRETCDRLAFKRLEVGGVEEVEGGAEAQVSFRVVYAYKHGTTTENQVLVERSRFVKEGDRWFYREKIPEDALSDALWRHGDLLAEPPRQDSALPKRIFGRAQPKLRPRSR